MNNSQPRRRVIFGGLIIVIGVLALLGLFIGARVFVFSFAHAASILSRVSAVEFALGRHSPRRMASRKRAAISRAPAGLLVSRNARVSASAR